MQKLFDELYEGSKQGRNFNNLYEMIVNENNILLAYRTIKSNKGSKTPGTDGFVIDNYKSMEKEVFIQFIKKQLLQYKPKAVRRVWIPKPNGDKRPLGIPTMLDRLVQQMIKQVLEPVCEARFYEHSYGFRPLRSTRHAISRVMFLINNSHFHYAVDIDIKGFFDNVNHTLLLKQLWNMGIRDKRVLKIIYKILKTPIKGFGVPDKGAPQGGILSPLLSNIVLNDLDQWIAGQWHHFKTKNSYANRANHKRALKTTKLKEGFIVRYADDFKILAKDYRTAVKWFHAVKLYLKDRLKLDISPEKSKIINLRKKKSEFLGYTIFAVRKRKDWVCNTGISEKKKKEIKRGIKERLKRIQQSTIAQNVRLYNSFILGLHNYFRYVTHVNIEMKKIAFDLSKTKYNRLKSIGSKEAPINAPPVYKKLYKNNYQTFKVCDIYLYPLQDIQTKTIWNFSQDKTLYTEKGRDKLKQRNLGNAVRREIEKLLCATIPNRTMEYMDNRISRYSMRMGKCEILKEFLYASEVHCHHYIPIRLGGADDYDNLRIIHYKVHKLIHATTKQTISKYLRELDLGTEQLAKINQYRKACNLIEIS